MARPTKKTPELLNLIGERLGRGEPLASICRDESIDIDPSTVRDWINSDEEVSRVIAHAREEGEKAIAYRLRATARGFKEDLGGDSTGDVQRDKLIIETDLKLLAKWNPRKWGDKLLHADSEGKNLTAPQFIVNPVVYKTE